MNYLSEGIGKLKKREFDAAFSCLTKGYFSCADNECACYLAQMFFDTQITTRTKEALMKSMLLWTITASHGKLSSLHKLGIAYQHSDDETVKEAGLEMIKKAYDGKYPLSSCVLGVMNYKKGKYDIACDYFENYQNIRNDKDAYYLYACCLLDKSTPDVHNGIRILDFCVQSNHDPRAARRLYDFYNAGGKNHDEAKALSYKKLQGDFGDKHAYEDLGVYYYVNNDYSSAVDYFKKAMPDLLDISYVMLGKMFIDDRIKNLELAEKYTKIALDMMTDPMPEAFLLAGKIACMNDNTQEGLDYLLKAERCGGPDYHDAIPYLMVCYTVQKDYNNAFKYIKRSEKYFGEIPQGLFQELLVMGDAYHLGVYGAEKNDSLAIKYYKRVETDFDAKSKNDSLEQIDFSYAYRAYNSLGDIYFQNDATLADALYYYSEFAEVGVEEAMVKAAKVCVRMGKIIDAVDYLTKAYGKGSKEAALCLSNLYLEGRVTGRKNKKMAKQWIQKAEQLK